ncbi:unnamed protein product [Parnassius mnemosyne]|uniref:115 kDa protein in type-1 retrotransposable element R1DM n=1 Tax=Parnassius mnemosyne TaxID=213953 RepID=A0AAV1KN67_9NEOP
MASKTKIDSTVNSGRSKVTVTTAGVMSAGISRKRIPSTTGGSTPESPVKTRISDGSPAYTSLSTPESSPASLSAKANRLYQEAKTQMEQSGNIKTSIKETVLSNLAGMYEIILRLSESRQTLHAQLEKARAESTATLLKREREHAEQLTKAHKLRTVTSTESPPTIDLINELIENLQDHAKTVVECKQHTIMLTEQLKQTPQNNNLERTYAQAVGSQGILKRHVGTRVVQRNNNRTKPVKAAIVVFDENVEIIESPTLTTENIAVAILKTNEWTMGVISIYMEDYMPIEPYLDNIKAIVRTIGTTKILLGGDSNAWSTWWGSVTEDHRGEALSGTLEELNLQILNIGNEPTFDTIRGGKHYKSHVDITACTLELLGVVNDWRIDKHVTSSDHNAIRFNIKLKRPTQDRQRSTTRIFNTKKANWLLFKEELTNQIKRRNIDKNEINNIVTKKALELMIENYIDGVKKTCEKTISLIKFKNRPKIIWWNEDLEKLKRDMNTKKRRIQCAAPSRKIWVVNEFLLAKGKYEEEVIKAQTESWNNFCTKQDSESMWDSIYRVMAKTTKRYEDQPLVRNGIALSVDESVKWLTETFFPDDREEDDNAEHQLTRLTASKPDSKATDKMDPPFTMAELNYVINTFNPKKAPGPDGLTADICSVVISQEPEVFLNIANKCLQLSHFPIPWKEARVIVIRKPGKDNYLAPKSHRPIGLLSVMGKMLEKMFIRRIIWHLQPQANPRQYGFVPQRSTEDALYDLLKHIRQNLTKKLINVIVSLDIEGAFDSAWWPAIQCRLAEKRCSIGGPTFWNILLDPLLDGLEKRGVYCQAFADDVVLIFSGGTSSVIQDNANNILAYVHEWGVKNKLKFAPHKTKAMIITKKLKYETPHIQMGGTEITLVEEMKLLGLTIDHKLTFQKHVQLVCRKAANIYKQLARTAKIEWGLNPGIIRTIYVAVVEPIILYAAIAWATASEKITIQKQLNVIQRGFAQKMCKTYRTVSLNAALLLSRLLPLDLRVQEAASLYKAKKGEPQERIGYRKIEGRVCFLKAQHPAKEVEITYECLEDTQPETLRKHNIMGDQIYTDGSKIEECVCDSQKEESVEHLLLEYPKYLQDRFKLEMVTNMQPKKENISKLLACKKHRNRFITYCIDIAKDVINRNKTK